MVVPSIFSFTSRIPDYFDLDGKFFVHWPFSVKLLASEQLASSRVPMMAEDRVLYIRFWHLVRSW